MQKVLFVLFYSALCLAGRAQYESYENSITTQFGVSGGVMNCITDLGGKSNVFKTFKAAGGMYLSAFYNDAIGARLELTWGTVTAADANADGAGVRSRNFSFFSDIAELNLLGEFHPLKLSPNYDFPLSPYLLGGIGTFSFNPKTKFNGNTVFLQPLHTEGEGFPETGRPDYKLTQIMIPAGGGLALKVSPVFTIKGELVYRFLKTDYLDDVSTFYIDPALFDKHLTPVTASLAKELYYRADEVNNDNSSPSVGSFRGNTAKDGYYSLNIKLQISLSK